MPPQQPSQRNEIVDWYNSIPPITKALFTLSIATTTVSTLGLVQPTSLILIWPAIKSKLQVSIKAVNRKISNANIFIVVETCLLFLFQ
jgi:hypothetical protein